MSLNIKASLLVVVLLASFGSSCFLSGWLFNVHIVSRIDPQGTLKDFQAMTMQCSKIAFNQATELEKIAGLKLSLVEKEEKAKEQANAVTRN
jgi:hypothetical protein